MTSWRRLEKNKSGFFELGPNGLLSNTQLSIQIYKNYHSNTNLLCWLPMADMLDTKAFLPGKNKVQAGTVAMALWSISTTFKLDVKKNPLANTQENIQRQFNNFWKDTDGKTHQPNQNYHYHWWYQIIYN